MILKNKLYDTAKDIIVIGFARSHVSGYLTPYYPYHLETEQLECFLDIEPLFSLGSYSGL
jgi:hypothetical protein